MCLLRRALLCVVLLPTPYAVRSRYSLLTVTFGFQEYDLWTSDERQRVTDFLIDSCQINRKTRAYLSGQAASILARMFGRTCNRRPSQSQLCPTSLASPELDVNMRPICLYRRRPHNGKPRSRHNNAMNPSRILRRF